MSLPLSFVPQIPFEGFKWKWASLECTEGLNDPVVLLGVLFRLRKLEQDSPGAKYSSKAFADELRELARDIDGRGIGVDLAGRTGERNLMRNSGQYWRALGLVPKNARGQIELTPFGRDVADRKISQSEFAALTVQTFMLPNVRIMEPDECARWETAGVRLRPLLLLLQILHSLHHQHHAGFLTRVELQKVIIPLSGCAQVQLDDYVRFVLAFRRDELSVDAWPDCCPSANDHRIAREFLLFLDYYGYVNRVDGEEERFMYAEELDAEISELLKLAEVHSDVLPLEQLQRAGIASEMERKRVRVSCSRPNQSRFRRAVLGASPRCIITNVTMPEVLEAAHIIPYKYRGEDTRANGLTMRMDIHQLFDSGHLRIHANGSVFLTDRARMDYGALIPPVIHFPEWINLDFVRWRWDNYNGL